MLEIKDVLSIFAAFVSFIALVKGVFEYTRAQRWKKAEFLSKEMKEFFADPKVRRALTLLDYNTPIIELEPDEVFEEVIAPAVGEEGATKRTVKLRTLSEEDLIAGLEASRGFRAHIKSDAVFVRQTFDHLFERLNFLAQYLKTGLFQPEDLKTYLDYWMNILCNPESKRKTPAFAHQVFTFWSVYGYADLIELAEKFGYQRTTTNS